MDVGPFSFSDGVLVFEAVQTLNLSAVLAKAALETSCTCFLPGGCEQFQT